MITAGKSLRIFEEHLRSIIGEAHDVLDIGTSERFAKELRKFEALFSKCKYIAAGFNPSGSYGRYSCDVHQDIQAMSFDDASFDAVICLEVLEHVPDPFRAVNEIKRVLRPRGRLFLTVPFLTSYHGKSGCSAAHEDYPDFWRFTHEGLKYLFADFTDTRVIPLDGPIEFRLKQLRFGGILNLPVVRDVIDAIDSPRLRRATSRHLMIGKK
jgi:SAM-dependent methyltransferase